MDCLKLQDEVAMGEANRAVLVGEVVSENLASFAVSGLVKFIPEGGAITK